MDDPLIADGNRLVPVFDATVHVLYSTFRSRSTLIPQANIRQLYR